jgi:hypothetical protein
MPQDFTEERYVKLYLPDFLCDLVVILIICYLILIMSANTNEAIQTKRFYLVKKSDSDPGQIPWMERLDNWAGKQNATISWHQVRITEGNISFWRVNVMSKLSHLSLLFSAYPHCSQWSSRTGVYRRRGHPEASEGRCCSST